MFYPSRALKIETMEIINLNIVTIVTIKFPDFALISAWIIFHLFTSVFFGFEINQLI